MIILKNTSKILQEAYINLRVKNITIILKVMMPKVQKQTTAFL
jgi:hypothetical protein